MLKFINRKFVFQWVLLLALLALSVYTIITRTQLANDLGATFQYKNFVQFFFNYEWIGKGIIIAVLLLQVSLLQYCFIKNEYTVKSSLLPACFYLSILLLTESLVIISPLFFTLLFFIIIISINYTTTSVVLKNNVFWVGMIIALGTCFDLSSIVLFFLVAITLIINQFFKIKEMAIMLFGFVLIYFYFFSYYYFTNNLEEWMLSFQQIKILGVLNDNTLTNTLPLVLLIVLGIIYFYFMIRTQLISESKVVVQRRRAVTLNMWAISMMACILISNSTYPQALGYLFVPISIYLAILVQERNPFYINEFITLATLIVLWL
jgi:hypothetical protein